jgi:molecular chaperone HtpG
MSNGIVFQVETTRVLQILASEIYDSPLALLRENVQNAYDAVRMRFAASGLLTEGARIDVTISNGIVSITDNGIGMDENVLRQNFWKAGSSGKNSEDAQKAGVVGTFGIGAMANFGVCTKLVVETRAQDSTGVFRSTAELASLKISEECISLEHLQIDRPVGTTVTAHIMPEYLISAEQAKQYLLPYVGTLQVPVLLNGENISGNTLESQLALANRQFTHLGTRGLKNNLCSGTFEVSGDSNGQVLVRVSDVTLGGIPIEGGLVLLQSGRQLMGLRSYFGLAPIPPIGAYQLGGIANLSFLKPTAGREALSRESIEQVTRLVSLAEWAATYTLAETDLADKNNAFLQWIINHNQYALAKNVSVLVRPDEKDVPFVKLKDVIGARTAHYYLGSDSQIVRTFANEGSCLLSIAQSNPRRAVQLNYVTNELKIPQVPDSVQVVRTYSPQDLNAKEVSVLIRIAAILRDDYLISDVEPVFADVSHNVLVYPQKTGDQLRIYIARSSPFLPSLIAFYDRAYELFTQFMKDFVRVQIYPRIQQFVPSSTRDGVDALRKILERNRELYRYEETEIGDFEGVLGDYLKGDLSFSQVLKESQSRARPYTQTVSPHQVGSVENEVPGVLDSPVAPMDNGETELAAAPPIIRDAVTSNMKILTTPGKYPQLNGFTMLLGLSDRLFRLESEFFHNPHTTRILWGGHRVVYIFTDVTGRLNLYYDIELRKPIDQSKAGGGMFRTTTLITKNRIFVPVPEGLQEEFRVATGAKEFFVRFDVISSPTGEGEDGLPNG